MAFRNGMWRLISLLAVAALAACSESSGAIPGTPSPDATTGSSASCRLPVASHWSHGSSLQETAGFVTFPSGTFTADSAAATGPYSGDVNDQSHPWKTFESPVLYGDPWIIDSRVTYDGAQKRWLPVVRAQVLPDGSAYVYTMRFGEQAEVHRVVVATATDTVVARLTVDGATGPRPAVAGSYRPEAIYLTTGDGAGLWRLDPATGVIEAIPSAGSARWVIAAGSAWSIQVHQDTGEAGTVSLVQMDLTTGALTTWQTIASRVTQELGGMAADPTLSLLGFDESARPLVEIPAAFENGAAGQVRLVTAPLASTVLDGLPQPANPPWQDPVAQFVTDSHGLWLGRADGIYLYANGKFVQMAPAPFGTEDYDIVGPCEK